MVSGEASPFGRRASSTVRRLQLGRNREEPVEGPWCRIRRNRPRARANSP